MTARELYRIRCSSEENNVGDYMEGGIWDILLLEGLCHHILTLECFCCVFGWLFCLLRSALFGYFSCCVFAVSYVSIVVAYCSASSTSLVASECSIFC